MERPGSWQVAFVDQRSGREMFGDVSSFKGCCGGEERGNE
jgi:hypothetical protein